MADAEFEGRERATEGEKDDSSSSFFLFSCFTQIPKKNKRTNKVFNKALVLEVKPWG